MKDRIYSKEQWSRALHALQEAMEVFVPVRDGDFHSFMPLSKGRRPDFGYGNTRLSAKGLLYPQSERMFAYTLEESDPGAHILREPEREEGERALVGVRPCDAHALELVRVNFRAPEYQDPWWTRRDEATTLVGLGCNAPRGTCFCTSVGGGPFSEIGLDVLLYDLGEIFLARSLTRKGERLLERAGGGGAAREDRVREAESLAGRVTGAMPPTVPMDRLKDKDLLALFEAPFWEEVAFSCINCGTCTYLCPTCWCFDIQDEVMGKQGDRIRIWDSCMFPLFTLHGSGHNPRARKVQRVRQRFMHKLKYYVDKYGGGVQCSGCGRCVRHCPVNIDIRQVAELMNQ